MEENIYSVYILTNRYHGVLYAGVTNNIYSRIQEHKNKISKGFTSRYNVNKLAYLEDHYNIEEAIAREKQIKAGSRTKNLAN